MEKITYNILKKDLPMYILGEILLCLCLLFGILFEARIKKAEKKVRRMGECEKYCLLEQMLNPFGFSFIPEQKVMTSTRDAWQRGVGYQALFDETAVYFNMVFDAEPIYFDYENRTWMIELWKGQYGLNTGGEIGVYRADSLIAPQERKTAIFKSVPDPELPFLSARLYKRERNLFCIRKKHWWLTGFLVGEYCEPEELSMKVTIMFPDRKMVQSFTEGLLELGYRECDLCFCGRTVGFLFDRPYSVQSHKRNFRRVRWTQLKNRVFCKLYRIVTKKFTETEDKILFLYFFLPGTVRHMLVSQKNKCQKWRKKR